VKVGVGGSGVVSFASMTVQISRLPSCATRASQDGQAFQTKHLLHHASLDKFFKAEKNEIMVIMLGQREDTTKSNTLIAGTQ
jgi:hypothetical protein